MNQRDGTGREVGDGFRMGNMCTPMADSCWCMAKPIQYCKVKKINKFKKKEKNRLIDHYPHKLIPLQCLISESTTTTHLVIRAEFRALFLILIFPESNQSSNSVKLVSSAWLTSLLNVHPCFWSRNHSVWPQAFAHAVVSVLQTILMSPSDLSFPWEISINH